ncbi:serine--tRNA ligase [Paenibacillus thermoaerophilus]|uniref:Serine--tRNA ligase n=1 Tax=Paenibacillus thermoaerophilus TaxID=1215385 RepID=A0ABW2V7A6_9BACL|nr:serine--tRNA ligase [Paenibacillus thermoaerophilus]TMV12459.1 serine--tRNA ligase [Paenibacillus thermoaerophilus]
MFDIKLLRNDLDRVREGMRNRGKQIAEIDRFTAVDVKRRELLQESETLKNRRNTVSQEVAAKKKAGENADALIAEMREVGDRIKALDDEIRVLDEELNAILLAIPNLPHESVPVGADENDNVELRRYGEPTTFDFEPLPHWELAQSLELLDFEAAAKVTGSRFVFYKGLGARLERALLNFMMDLHSGSHGYTEMIPPYMVNRDSLTGTGQLPKFEEDVFKLAGTDYFMIPTAEVPVTNYHRDEILSVDDLPKNYVAYSMNFRSEAGAAGRDTRGLIRQHQFNKIELVKLTTPESSYDELEKLTQNAERVLQLLKLPYRVMTLCTGDLGFSSAKTYDIEVWLPSAGVYREISSCSNFEDFQARRANIRFRREPKAKPEFVHTLNGSGLAIGRTFAAILENYQQADGSIVVPEVLRPYMGGLEVIRKP